MNLPLEGVKKFGMKDRGEGEQDKEKKSRTKPEYVEFKDMNLQQELTDLYAEMKALLQDVLVDKEVPTNQRAQVANSCRASLQELAKTRTELYNAERLQKLEQILLKVLKTLPEHAQKAFMAEYEAQLGDL